MAELNFNALIPEGPRGFYQGFEQGQDQRIARETNQFKLDELKRDRDEAMQLQAKLKSMGQDPDLNKYMDTLMATGKPEYVQMAIEGKQKLKDLEAYAKLGSGGAAPSAMPTGAPAPSVMRMPQAPAATNALGSGMFGMEPSANALAAQAAPMVAPAPVNALAPQAQQAQQRITQLLDFARTNPRMAKQAMEEARILQDQLELFSKRGQNEPADAVMMRQLGYPLTAQGYQDYVNAKKPSTLRSPEEEAQAIRIARESRPPVQPVAPTITQIVDPSNPNQMITIDARRYQGGGAGSPGVLGIGGKEPTAAVRISKVEAGKTQLADDLDNLRSSFQTLDKLRAVPSTERGAISNLTSALASSRAGQLTGQAFATEAQVERDVINSARSRLVNSIKNATGMSAQQLNSNVELQTMLKSISDPGQSYQSAIRIIDDIEKAYVTGGGALSKRNQPAANVVTNPQFPGFSIPGKQ